MKITFAIILALSSQIASADQLQESTCYGTPGKGRLGNGRKLPASGKNFEAYSLLGVTMRRNYVHSKVYEVILDAYDELQTNAPG